MSEPTPIASAKALVLFSGGQDSTACLAWALEKYEHVETLGFDYGQRHRIELDCRKHVLQGIRAINPEWNTRLGDDHEHVLSALSALSDTALTSDMEIEMGANGLPNTFVPGRNLLFFTYAAALAYRRGLEILVGGMCETDYSGYPDCRKNTLDALEQSIRLGMEKDFVIETPLMWLDKAQTWAMAQDLGGKPLIDLTIEETHSCYKGDRATRHHWGYGCGDCPACNLRQKGYETWRANTPNPASE